ncbi:MAG: ClpXP protease specificity-enhancing factor SspB [Pseudomonadota bacterium]
MTIDTIDYGSLMHRAMRGLIRDVLDQVAEYGLPGDHHFFITFSTKHPGVEVAEWLSERYPDEMTVVMQNWYEGLVVTDDGFEVTLNFGDTPERLYIPYDALETFVDPSVEFGLRFEALDHGPEDDTERETVTEAPMAEDVAQEPHPDAEIVSLDKFRK